MWFFFCLFVLFCLFWFFFLFRVAHKLFQYLCFASLGTVFNFLSFPPPFPSLSNLSVICFFLAATFSQFVTCQWKLSGFPFTPGWLDDCFLLRDRLVGLVVKAYASRFQVRILLAPGFFRGRVIPVTYKLATRVQGASLGDTRTKSID